MKKIQTNIPFNYITIKITQSRIAKGLLAIPVSLIDKFPKKNRIITVFENDKAVEKPYTSYNSSSKECRIGGMQNFYKKYKIQNGDELVIIILSNNNYKIIPEKIFKKEFQTLENKIDNTIEDHKIDLLFKDLSKLTNQNQSAVMQNEFIRLATNDFENRKIIKNKNIFHKDSVPPAIRNILLTLYQGKCQLSNFTFMMKNDKPYFELHHINPKLGHHVKNLLVVSPNIHAQFTHANFQQIFDNDGWLRKVIFDYQQYNVFQAIDNIDKKFYKETHNE
ncbi:MAG: HNH endonuclease [Alphaproteobacteria bacterium]